MSFIKEDILKVKELLPNHYVVQEAKKKGSIHCTSIIGELKDDGSDPVEHWEEFVELLRQHFEERFVNIEHNHEHPYVDFTIYLMTSKLPKVEPFRNNKKKVVYTTKKEGLTFDEAYNLAKQGKLIRKASSEPGTFIQYNKPHYVPIERVGSKSIFTKEFLKANRLDRLNISEYWNKWNKRNVLVVGYRFDDSDKKATDWEVYEIK